MAKPTITLLEKSKKSVQYLCAQVSSTLALFSRVSQAVEYTARIKEISNISYEQALAISKEYVTIKE